MKTKHSKLVENDLVREVVEEAFVKDLVEIKGPKSLICPWCETSFQNGHDLDNHAKNHYAVAMKDYSAGRSK